MSITLTPRTEALIQEKLESGRYASADEVIEEAVKLLEARERFERLRASLIEAEEQIRQGKILELTPELRQRIRDGDIATAHTGIPPDSDVCPEASARDH